MLVLGIETSCDETGLALVADGREVLGAQIASSLKQHQRFGGVVPEIASRAHLELFTAELEVLLERAGVTPDGIDRIAVTRGPGLAGCLAVGVIAAQALGLAWKKPVIGVNHLQAHLYAAVMPPGSFSHEEPMVGLAISGGHTAILRMRGLSDFELMGQTRDDAVGEAFDKVAKLLGLGFPGGPEIQRAAEGGNPNAFQFSVPRIKRGTPYDFSLSGIKTAVFYRVREEARGGRLSDAFVADMAASFQSAIVEEVVGKVLAACEETGRPRLAVGGGVIANRRLRERLTEACGEAGVRLAIPPFSLCTDNGAMVGGLGAWVIPATSPLTVIPDLGVRLS
ncbi:MAG: tRNA (adenosine(37)-N6)-threonylcarbamoyltransferase complex transferase subunit TsaD [Candidatus Omnitrophica bacterium CG11_big_fil_rev_8_21_14_0_20_64_10]|nr:MAG: tRNA (adenosine(37)-N6)-threonylcarbamoyltransferase complex transferase subunit TsaD [Candidatus Omnitrophica bacterium CG11_big_fil_rev_8_21_14_0_20_64_10]